MPYKKGEPILWEHLTWVEAEAICKKVGMAIICVGAIEQRRAPLVDGAAGLEVVRILAAAQESIEKKGEPVYMARS